MAPPVPNQLIKMGLYIRQLHPIFERLVRAAYATWMRVYVQLKTRWNFRDYDVSVDPFEVIYVDTAEITSVVRGPSRRTYACDIRGGDWDQTSTEPLSEYFGYRGFVQHFEEDMEWEDTDLYARGCEVIVDQGRKTWDYSDIESFRNHLDEIDELYSDIAKNGYKNQYEIAAEQGGVMNIGGLPVGIDEISVAICRDGEICLIDGRHRLFCAKLLDIDEVPVRVTLRHEDWL